MTSLWQFKGFEARISLYKSLDCPLVLAAVGRNQRFTRYPPVINHNLGWCNSLPLLLLVSSSPLKKKSNYHVLLSTSLKVNKSSVHVLLQFPPSQKFMPNSHTTLYRKFKFNTLLGYSACWALSGRRTRRSHPIGGGSATFEIVALKKKKNGVGRGQGRKKL